MPFGYWRCISPCCRRQSDEQAKANKQAKIKQTKPNQTNQAKANKPSKQTTEACAHSHVSSRQAAFRRYTRSRSVTSSRRATDRSASVRGISFRGRFCLWMRTMGRAGGAHQRYDVVFTSGATAGLKMVGEYFPWSEGSVFYHTRECHNR